MENTEFKGTKGNWRVSKITGVIMGVGVDLGDGYSKDIFHFTDLEDKENKANAQLIASAPIMLEALQNLENDNNQIPNHAWEMVQKAIQKAIG